MSAKYKKVAKKQEEVVGRPEVEEEHEHEEEEKEAITSSSFFPTAGQSEISGSLKNFRHHPDMENFYRFIYENDLRHEALSIIVNLLNDKRKKVKA